MLRTARVSLLALKLSLAGAVAVTTTVAAPTRAYAAADAEADLVAAEAAFGQLAYEDALTKAEAASKVGGLTHQQLERVYKVLAYAAAAMGQDDKARDAFVRLLTYDPEFVVDKGQGPKIEQPFLEARGFWRGQATKPGVEATPLLREGESGTMRVTVRDPTRIVTKAIVAYRWGTAAPFKRHEVMVGDQTITIPAAPAGTTRLDYFVQAFDAQNNAVFELGNESVPKTSMLEIRAQRLASPVKTEEGGGSVFGSPVFWIIAGVLVAGGATATALVLTGGKETRERIITDPPTGANVGPILFCGGDRCR